MRKKFLASLLSLCLLIGLLPTAALAADAETPTADTCNQDCFLPTQQ